MRTVQHRRHFVVRSLVVALSILASGTLTGCGGDGGSSLPPPPADDTGLPAFTGVWVIVMENHAAANILEDPDADTFRDLAARYASAARYSATKHPSLPNYIDLTCGCDDDHWFFDLQDNPASDLIHADGNDLFTEPSLGGQLEAAEVDWRAYAQDSAPGSDLGPCSPADTGHYAARHFPFVYFQDLYGTGSAPSQACVDRLRVFGDFQSGTGEFYSDLASGGFHYQWITPDKIWDMHDGTVAQGDRFVGSVVASIQATEQWKQGGVIFVTFDEGSLDLFDDILFIAISPYAKRSYTSPIAYDHDNFLATIEDIYGLPRLGRAQGKANMADLFEP